MHGSYSLHARRGLRRALYVWAALALSALLLSCGSNVEKKVKLAQLSSTCRINTDCASPLVCTFQLCHQACDTSRDCAHGERCVESAASRNVCQLPTEQGCTATGHCPGNEVCGVDAQCRDGCSSDDDCVSEQVCTSGTCADKKELGDGGALTPSPERPQNTPPPCAFDSDCAEGLRCIDRACRVECGLNSDCAKDQTCENARCQPIPSEPGCRYNSDCADDQLCDAGTCTKREPPPTPVCQTDLDCKTAGQHCEQQQCVCECQTSADCARGQSCDGACACTADLVIHGDVMVSNDVELAELENVVEITGQLQLALPGDQGVLHVPHLRKVKQLFAYRNGFADPHLVFDELEEVTTNMQCLYVCEAPHLKKVSTLVLGSQVADSIEYPELQTIDSLNFSGLMQATRASFPKIQTLVSMSLGSNPMLSDLSLPALTKLQGLQVYGDGFAGDFALPTTEVSGNLQFNSNRHLTSISLPGAVNTADTYFTGSPLLTSISLPALKTASRLYLADLQSLKSLDLNALESMAAELDIQGQFSSFTLTLPALKQLVAVQVEATTKGLVGLELPALSELQVYSVSSSNIEAIDLPKLTSAQNVSLESNLELTRLSVPALPSAASFYVNNSEKLTDLDLSSLASVANTLTIHATGIKNVDTLDPTLGGKLANAGVVSIVSNPDLPSCLVADLLTHMSAPPYNWMGSADNQNNCDCPGACP